MNNDEQTLCDALENYLADNYLADNHLDKNFCAFPNDEIIDGLNLPEGWDDDKYKKTFRKLLNKGLLKPATLAGGGFLT